MPEAHCSRQEAAASMQYGGSPEHKLAGIPKCINAGKKGRDLGYELIILANFLYSSTWLTGWLMSSSRTGQHGKTTVK